MDQNLNKEIELKDRLLQIFKNNKLKIFFTLIILIFSLFAYFLVEINSNKKNKFILIKPLLFFSFKKKQTKDKIPIIKIIEL